MPKKREKAEKADRKKELLKRIRERYQLMFEADQENRRQAMDDMKFTNVPGEQWDALMKKDRGDRPCYEFNKLRITCKRVINDIRANRPAGKVRAVEEGDKKTAEIYEGLIRNIWNNSDGDTVIDQAAEYQVIGGMGAWRITTKYRSEDVFEQDICIEPIQNPFCLYCDPSAKDMLKRDAQDFILTDRVSKKSYESRWPDAEKVDWDVSEFDDESEWTDEETVRVVEYWYKEPYEKELWQLADGKVIDSASDEAALIDPQTILKKRVVTCDRVKMCIASGDAILEEADWAGAHLPFVMVYGESMILDGKHIWWGLPRFAKDAQRSYNISRTAVAETIAMTPQAKIWATTTQAKGLEKVWAEAHKKNFPWMLYEYDPKAPGPPQKMGGADVPVALIQEAAIASEEIKAVTGIYDASLGNRSNETSGRAINARQEQGEIANFNYMDNLSKGIRRNWEILIDLIPKVYDTARELRILGNDGAESYASVNQMVVDPETNQAIKVNDLATGKYDVAITIGPSWATKRQEAAEVYSGMAQSDPGLMASAPDLIYKSLDLPYADEIAERRKALLPPQIQQMLSKDKPLPPEAQAAMTQATEAMKMVEQVMGQVQQAAQKVQQDQMQVDKGKSEIQVGLANLKAEKADFEALVAKSMSQLVTKEAQLTIKETQQAGTEQVQSVAGDSNNSIAAIQQAAQEFMQAAAQVLQTIGAQAQQQQLLAADMARKPRLVKMVSQRVNGNLEATPIYEDQMR